jgi:hypothetical protein
MQPEKRILNAGVDEQSYSDVQLDLFTLSCIYISILARNNTGWHGILLLINMNLQ